MVASCLLEFKNIIKFLIKNNYIYICVCSALFILSLYQLLLRA